MRGMFRTSSEPNKFAQGFVAAVMLFGALIGLWRLWSWLSKIDPVAAFVSWWTTPIGLTPIELTANLLPLALLILIGWAVVMLMQL